MAKDLKNEELYALLLNHEKDRILKALTGGNIKATDLCLAARANDLQLVKGLLAAGVPANTKDYCGNSALYYAINNYTEKNDTIEIVNALLDAKASPNTELSPMASNAAGRRVLTYWELIKIRILVRNNIKPIIELSSGIKILAFALIKKFDAAVISLLKYGADPNTYFREQGTMLSGTAKILHQNKSALHVAVESDNSEAVIRALVAYGAHTTDKVHCTTIFSLTGKEIEAFFTPAGLAHKLNKDSIARLLETLSTKPRINRTGMYLSRIGRYWLRKGVNAKRSAFMWAKQWWKGVAKPAQAPAGQPVIVIKKTEIGQVD